VSAATDRKTACPLARVLTLFVMLPLVASCSCASLTDRGRTLVPTRYQARSGPFIIFSNVNMSEDSAAIRCLQALVRDLNEHLDYAPGADDEPVEIYVLDNRNAFTHFLKFYYPELPSRRAFFLAQGEHRVVYTYTNPRLEEDLRHEATHALLRRAFGDLPLWLDEGLSEYFETDLAASKANSDRIKPVMEDLAGGWSPELKRLEKLSDIREMTPRDYREAWAWVHLFLDDPGSGRSQLLRCLAQFRDEADKHKLAAALEACGASNERLLAHLKGCQSRLATAEPVLRGRAVRLQDKTVEPPVSPVHPPGLFQRVRAWIGL
jgi:hypothetical protein